MKKQTIKELDKVQLKYLRVVTGIGKGCPIPLLLYHTGTLSMSNRILVKKIMFLNHVSNLPRGTLSRDAYDTQCRHNIGLVAELLLVLEQLGLTDIQSYNKYSLKKILRRKIVEKKHGRTVGNGSKLQKDKSRIPF